MAATIHSLLSEYGESHQNPLNKKIHWICVPVIFFSIVGLLYGVKLPGSFFTGYRPSLAELMLLLTVIYYARLSNTLWIGMFLFSLLCISICSFIEQNDSIPLWLMSLILFVVAWIGQFYGHKVEGKKPSFLKDIQFLLIGPAWLMHFIYKKIGIRI